MNRITNIHCLCQLVDAFEQTRDQTSRMQVRQAMYVHGIIEAVLSERVDLLPEVCRATL